MTHFLNVDLELVTRVDPGPLLSHLQRSTVVLRNSVDEGLHTVWLELPEQPHDPETAIDRFTQQIDALPPSLRRHWDVCDDRCFNIGVQAGATPLVSTLSVSSRVLQRAASLAARLAITIYAAEAAPP